tara:strand:+ start:1041 stop:2585 length:1545 start_codon:yes stop_codon:yes gene_type:complete
MTNDIELHKWQAENVDFIEKNKFVLIADEMGLGKTFSALAAVKKNNLYPCLIICPKSLKINWEREIKRIDHYKKVEILDGVKKKGVIKEPEQVNGRFSSDYIILQYPQGDNAYNFVKNLPQARSIILDEIHMLKSYKAKRTLAVREYIRDSSMASHVIGLSGTPMLNRDASEIFTVASVLHSNVDENGKAVDNQRDGDGGLITYDEFYGDGDNKFVYTKYWQDKKIGYGITPEKQIELNHLLKDRGIMIRHTKDLLKDLLPPMSKIPVVLPKPKDYNKELNRLESVYGDIKIAQLTMIRKWLAEEKVKDTVEYVEDIIDQGDYFIDDQGKKVFNNDNDKVIVFGNYQEATIKLGNKFGVVAITGKTPSDERQPIIDKFQSDPNVRVLVITVRTGNVGLNLVEANHVVFNDYSYSPSDMMQAEARIYRLGQTKKAYVHYLTSQGTVDEDVIGVLTTKQNIINGIIDGVEYKVDSQEYKNQERGVENLVLGKLKEMMKSQKIQKTKTAMFKQKKRK